MDFQFSCCRQGTAAMEIDEDDQLDSASLPQVETEKNNGELVELLPCDKCGGHISSDEMKEHNKEMHHPNFPYRCPPHIGKRCRRRFKTEINLSIHVRKHHHAFLGERKWNCRYCDHSFVYKHSLDEHVEQFDFRCEVCGAKFHTKKTYEKHASTCLRILESWQSKDFSGSWTPPSSSLKHQSALHTPGHELPIRTAAPLVASGELLRHGCSNCHERFRNRSQLHTHLKDVHNRTPMSWLPAEPTIGTPLS